MHDTPMSIYRTNLSLDSTIGELRASVESWQARLMQVRGQCSRVEGTISSFQVRNI